MKKIFPLIFLLTGCVGAAPLVDIDEVAFYEIGEEGAEIYFQYPATARITDEELSYQECKVRFGFGNPEEKQTTTVSENVEDEVVYKAFFEADVLVYYTAYVSTYDFGFWMERQDLDLGNCIDLVSFMSESLAKEIRYVNNRFSFSAILPEDYEVNYLENEGGVFMKKRVEREFGEDELNYDEEEPVKKYEVEMAILPKENFEDYADLSAFIGEEYPGYSIEYADFGGASGYFVGEGFGKDSIRHFFAMDEGKDYIYELYIKVPSQLYNFHLGEFDSLVEEFAIF